MSAKGQKNSWTGIAIFLIALTVVTALMLTGKLSFDPISVSEITAYVFLAIFALYFLWIYVGGDLNAVEKKGMWAILLVCVASACFWSGFEQAGSSLNLFGRDLTDRTIFGYEFPTTWLQNANPTFIILLTPFFL